MSDPFEELTMRAAALIASLADGSRDDEGRDALLLDLARAQAEVVAPYRRLVASRGVAIEDARTVDAVPALPTDVFRFARVSRFDESETQRVFRTSGTTHGARGEHHLRDLSLYDRAARAAARRGLFRDDLERHLIILAPHPSEAPDSSLSYMLGRFESWFGEGRSTWAFHDGALDLPALEAALEGAIAAGQPVALLGTSFAFVHADDALEGRDYALPESSFVMQTGGFKGRSREVAPEAMRNMIAKRYGVAESAVVAEYGMTELSSQMYETTLHRPAETRRLWVPGWVRATPVDPESLEPVARGEVGILRIDDVANVETVAAIQTADLARRVEDGIVLIGRAPGTVPRGCSLAMDEALGDARP